MRSTTRLWRRDDSIGVSKNQTFWYLVAQRPGWYYQASYKYIKLMYRHISMQLNRFYILEMPNDQKVIIVGILCVLCLLFIFFMYFYCIENPNCANRFSINVHNFNNLTWFTKFFFHRPADFCRIHEAKLKILTLKHNLIETQQHFFCVFYCESFMLRQWFSYWRFF